MMDWDRNRKLNAALSALYEEYSAAYLTAYIQAFGDVDPPERINEFGIIDEERYDADIAYVDDKPGLLFMALYDDEECELQSIPTERDAKIAALREKCERLEKLTKQISPEAEIGIGEDTGFDTELVMFIPTETVQPLDALRLLFLMNEYALSDPPDRVEWDNSQLIAFAQRYLPESDVRTEMIVQLEK